MKTDKEQLQKRIVELEAQLKDAEGRFQQSFQYAAEKNTENNHLIEENQKYKDIFTRITHTASISSQYVDITLLRSTWQEIMELLDENDNSR
jgi:hypothetical protein